jgi:UDP-glucose 4-epimerase
MPSFLNGKTVTITGGTGSFGSTLAKHLLKTQVNEIRIFSRDENKQDQMRRLFKDERLRFFLGDTRDLDSVNTVIKNTDYVFHAAALKQVPSCEFFPMQAVATNIMGSQNVITSAFQNEVEGIVCLSTDKAAYPINSMGISKAMMEKVAYSFARDYQSSRTRIAVTRYGNVMMSRGSVIPLFIDQLLSAQELTVTDPSMTRFLMSLGDSVDLVNFAFENATSGDLFVRKAPACSVKNLITGVALALNLNNEVKIRNIGIRHGEKKDEVLLGMEESMRSIDMGDYFRVPLDARSLDYEIYFDKGQNQNIVPQSFTSSNTKQLNPEEVASLLLSLPEFNSYLAERKN